MGSMRRGAVCGLLSVCMIAACVLAAEKTTLAQLSKSAMEATSAQEIFTALSALRESYLGAGQYNEYVEFLVSFAGKKKSAQPIIDYFIASARYAQLLHLEDRHLWDEYFSMGNTYRDDITTYGRRARDASAAGDPVAVYSRIVLWEFHQHQQDAFLEEARDDLLKAAEAYAAHAGADAEPLKAAADTFVAAGERGRARQIYRLYVDTIAAQGLSPESIAKRATTVLAGGNSELAQSMFDLAVKDIVASENPDESARRLIEIARRFVYAPAGAYDMAYAEELFSRAEQVAGIRAFSEEMLYSRAQNLQAAGEFADQRKVLQALLDSYPSTDYERQVRFKMGILDAFALRDGQGAQKQFETVISSKGNELDVYHVLSLYHLGVLLQWEGRNEEAAGRYKEIAQTQGLAAYPEIAAAAEERLQEIEGGRDLEYHLKTFLDLSLLEEHSRFAMTKVVLAGDPKLVPVHGAVAIEARPVLGPTGCFQVDVQYLWSGDVGSASVNVNESQFSTTYPSKGPKAVCVVVNAPTGFVDRNFILVDVE